MRGMAEEVRGMLSAIISRNTVKASNTEMPNAIFSPEKEEEEEDEEKKKEKKLK